MGQGQNSGFAAHPRVVQQKQKFKDPYSGQMQDEYYPQNIMYDKRVFRGSTNAAMVIPSGGYPDALFDNRKEKARAKAQARAAAAEEFFTRDVRTPEPLQGRQNIDIQTDQFVEELTDKAPCYEIGCQTEIKIERPQTPRFMPKKHGVDKKTLIEDNELFIFDFEVEPILSVLCGKTLELSRMEVLEEEELREMREQQEHYKRMTAAEVADIERMEATEAKRLADFEKQKNNMREKKKNKQLAHRKVVARTVSKDYLGRLRENVFKRLTDVGFYTDSFKVEVLDNDVVPWLHTRCFEFIQDLEVQESVPTAMAKTHLLSEEEEHMATVKAETERKKQVKEEKERQLAVKQGEKRQRKAGKEAKRKGEERAALGAEIQEKFISKGVSKAIVAVQELLEADGEGRHEPTLGALGGVLGQIILVLSIMEKNFNRTLTSKSTKSKKSNASRGSTKKKDTKAEEDAKKKEEEDAKSQGTKTENEASIVPMDVPTVFDPAVEPVLKEKGWFTRQNIQNFLHHYISEKMPYEKIQFVVGHAYLKMINGLEKPMKLNEMRVMKEPNYSRIRETLRDPKLYGDRILSKMAENTEKVGMSFNSYHMIHEGFWDLYCKKPATTDLTSKKLDGWLNFIHMKVPHYEAPDDEEDAQPATYGLPVKAVARIRIPFKKMEPLEEGEEPEMDAKSAKSGKSGKSGKKPKEEPVPEEIEPEDKIEAIPTQGDQYQIYVLHQHAQRLLRESIAKEFKDYLPDLAALDEEEMLTTVEKEAEQYEKEFFANCYDDMPVFDFEKN